MKNLLCETFVRQNQTCRFKSQHESFALKNVAIRGPVILLCIWIALIKYKEPSALLSDLTWHIVFSLFVSTVTRRPCAFTIHIFKAIVLISFPLSVSWLRGFKRRAKLAVRSHRFYLEMFRCKCKFYSFQTLSRHLGSFPCRFYPITFTLLQIKIFYFIWLNFTLNDFLNPESLHWVMYTKLILSIKMCRMLIVFGCLFRQVTIQPIREG